MIYTGSGTTLEVVGNYLPYFYFSFSIISTLFIRNNHIYNSEQYSKNPVNIIVILTINLTIFISYINVAENDVLVGHLLNLQQLFVFLADI